MTNRFLPYFGIICFSVLGIVSITGSLATMSAQTAPSLELGTFALSQTNRTQWHAVTFETPFTQAPVVILGPPSAQNSEGLVAVVRSVTVEGFECQLAEWSSLDGEHPAETISYLAIAPGTHDFGGVVCRAGVATLLAAEGTQSLEVAFESPFSGPPIVISQAVVSSTSGQDIVAARLGLNTAGGFTVQALREAIFVGTAPQLDVHWIALESDEGQIGSSPFEAVASAGSHNNQWQEESFSRGYVEPVVFASIQSGNSSGVAGVRLSELGESSVRLRIDQAGSTIPESVGLLVIGDRLVDSDGDGMPDDWEIANGLNPTVADGGLDLDGDGLSNLDEFLKESLPQVADTDGDGLVDGFEAAVGWQPGKKDMWATHGVRSLHTRLLVFNPVK